MSSNSYGVAPNNPSSRHGTRGERGGGGRTAQTAHLHRFVSLNDRFDTQIFTFIVPAHLYLGYVQEIYSKEFNYSNQQWNLKLVRTDHHIGVFLVLRNALSGMSVRLDYTFVVINREHFTRNETTSEKEAEFTAEVPTRGRPQLIEVSDLAARNFLFDDHVFLLEVQLKSSITIFRDCLVLPRESARDMAPRRLESSYFNYGSCDWNLSIEPTDADGTAVLLSRQSRFEHWCRITYRVIFSSGPDPRQRAVDTGVIEHLMDIDGYGRSHPLDDNVFRLVNSKGQLHIEIKMITMNPMAIVELVPTSRTKNLARFYDCEKREWLLESDILGKLVKFRLFYADIHNLPPFFTRLVAFKVYIVPYDRNHSLVRGLSSPYCCFYAQKEIDDGFEVSMNLPVEKVCDPAAGYVHPQQGILTVQIEWVYNHLLCYDQYHYYDNISRLHKHQMSREILALQAENYALEKQVHNFQVNLSIAPDGTPTGNPAMQGVPQGMPPGMPPGMPHAMQHGVPQGQGMPPGMPPGMPHAMQHGVPQGQGMPLGMSQGIPPGMTQGVSSQRSSSRGVPQSSMLGPEPTGYSHSSQSSVYNAQDRLRRSLPNAPSPQPRRQAQYGDVNGPPVGSGRHGTNHSSAFSSPARSASPVARKGTSPATPRSDRSDRGYAKQRNGRAVYDEGASRSGRRMEERW